MNEPLIRDIPIIKKNLENMRNIATFKRVMPLFRPILKLLGAETDNDLTDVDSLVQQAEELALIPDLFNDLFASRGWIIYELLNLEAAQEAIKIAQTGDLDGAENVLVDNFDAETVRWNLSMMNAIKAFRPRLRLAHKALTDYEEERYHACVPVVLALLDGLVNELHEKRRGFFAQDVDLTAWDSIAGHSRGLNVLSGIFQKGRRKTTTEQITIPYRNGIMHGMDLGYDNKIVAAKTWAALFATRDWALKAEKGELTAPPEKPEKTWGEIFRQISETAEEKKRLEQWEPREIVVGIDIPKNGEPDSFDDGTPEKKLAEYLKYWKARNYGFMAKCISPLFGSSNRTTPAKVREIFESKNLKTFEFSEVSDIAPAVTLIHVNLEFEEYDREVKKSHMFRMMYLDEKGKSTCRDKPNCDWTVTDWEVY